MILETRGASYLRVYVNQGVWDDFVIKLNVVRLNVYSEPVRVKYYVHFVSGMKVKMNEEVELQKTFKIQPNKDRSDQLQLKQTPPFSDGGVCDQAHTHVNNRCTKWAITKHSGCYGSFG